MTDSQREAIIYPLCPQIAHPSDAGNFLPITHFRTGCVHKEDLMVYLPGPNFLRKYELPILSPKQMELSLSA